jgi:hypothetical protein
MFIESVINIQNETVLARCQKAQSKTDAPTNFLLLKYQKVEGIFDPNKTDRSI